MAEISGANLAQAGDFDRSRLNIQVISAEPRLITADEAMERISLLLSEKVADVKRRLLTIAGIAIAASIALDGTALEVENVAGLQESVNCALFVSSRH